MSRSPNSIWRGAPSEYTPDPTPTRSALRPAGVVPLICPAASVSDGPIRAGNLVYRRARPSKLTKKLERMIWNPSVIAVAAGMTTRRVLEKSRFPKPRMLQA